MHRLGDDDSNIRRNMSDGTMQIGTTCFVEQFSKVSKLICRLREGLSASIVPVVVLLPHRDADIRRIIPWYNTDESKNSGAAVIITYCINESMFSIIKEKKNETVNDSSSDNNNNDGDVNVASLSLSSHRPLAVSALFNNSLNSPHYLKQRVENQIKNRRGRITP